MSEANQNRDSDLVDKALHKFDHVLDLVHDKLLRPILLTGRFVAYGFIVLLASIVLFGAFVIGLVRLLNVYLFAGHEWLSYLVIGAISLVIGLIIWRRRRPVTVRK